MVALLYGFGGMAGSIAAHLTHESQPPENRFKEISAQGSAPSIPVPLSA
jgi:hypothetical protein